MEPEHASRQSQEKADGVMPAGFFSTNHPSEARICDDPKLSAVLKFQPNVGVFCAPVVSRTCPWLDGVRALIVARLFAGNQISS